MPPPSPSSPPSPSPAAFFYYAELADAGECIALEPREAIHAVRARRCDIGDAVCVTDGNGALAHCVVVECNARPASMRLRIVRIETAARDEIEIALACAIPKGDAQAVLLDSATQLGMHRFIPLAVERSVLRYRAAMGARWRRILISACKQSRRCYLPTIDAESTLDELLATRAPGDAWLAGARDGESLFAHKAGIIDVHANAQSRAVRRIVLLVGPEGGLNRAERELLARANVKHLALGAHVLRIETAAAALLAVANQLTLS